MQIAGSLIREKRLERGWTQTQLHLAAHVNLGDISRIERGRLMPTQAQLQRLVEVLDIDPFPGELEQRIAS